MHSSAHRSLVQTDRRTDSIPITAVTCRAPSQPHGGSAGPGKGQDVPKQGSANERGRLGCIPAPLRLINLITPLQITREAKLRAWRGGGP